jgi:hypothetical protein
VRETVGAVLGKEGDLSAANKTVAADALIGAAIDSLNKSFEAPPDVACSMSLMTYDETNDIFGLRIAKDYVAVQVIVRNLNQADEYLLHDVQMAVDTDPCGSFAQFDGGRDRQLVRAVALRNQFTDPRNRWVRIVEGVGVVASSAVGFASHDYSLGLGVYNSLAPAGKAIFPDYTIDQLNRLSDLAFTSSGQTRTVVGKKRGRDVRDILPSETAGAGVVDHWFGISSTQTVGDCVPKSRSCPLRMVPNRSPVLTGRCLRKLKPNRFPIKSGLPMRYLSSDGIPS